MYALKQHRNLTADKWFSYPREQQVLMIANELNRAKNWIEKQDNDHINACYERAMELTDLMSEDPKWQNQSLKELRRFREMLSKIYSDSVKDRDLNLTLYRLLLQMNPKAWNLLAGER